MKKHIIIILSIFCILSLVACGKSDISEAENIVSLEMTEIPASSEEEIPNESEEPKDTPEISYIDTTGMTLETRIAPPQDYERVPAEVGSFAEFRRNYSVKEGGSPGHVVMIVDVCENGQGEKAFLLAQGYMPAQEFHVLKNPAHEENPWYYESEITYPLQTPEYIFSEGSLWRLSY